MGRVSTGRLARGVDASGMSRMRTSTVQRRRPVSARDHPRPLSHNRPHERPPPPPRNEPVLQYKPGSPERVAVRRAIDELTAGAPASTAIAYRRR